MQAFILAAGLGTRLQPLTLTTPKALVTINGKPLIDILIDKLLDNDINDLIVNVHHLADQIVRHLDNRNGIKHLAISDETAQLLETGGAIRHAAPYINANTPLLIHNVDIISNLDITAMKASHSNERLATLLVSNRKTQRYLLFDDDMRLVGWYNEATGQIKPEGKNINPSKLQKLAFAGTHIVNPQIVGLMRSYPERFSIIDFYLDQMEAQPIYGYIQPDFQMVDVGKFDALEQAEQKAKEILDQR